MQYSEHEQIAAWSSSHPNDRLLEVDVPLSFGVVDVSNDPNNINQVEVTWDPLKDVGIYIKVSFFSKNFVFFSNHTFLIFWSVSIIKPEVFV